tara:strand:- start:285 stop:407 length:123 start_codon:yes stop_codon:yes gene_type:complete
MGSFYSQFNSYQWLSYWAFDLAFNKLKVSKEKENDESRGI